MAENNWFSFFREGVRLLGTLWSEQERKRPKNLFSEKPGNVLWSRHIAVQKARAARARTPGQITVHKAMVARSNAQGHGARFQSQLYGRAWAAGLEVLTAWGDVTLPFLQIIFIFLSSFFKDWRKQRAKVAQAMQWMQQEGSQWQTQPWYGFLFRKLQAKCRAYGPSPRGIKAFSWQAQKPHQVVGKALQQGGADFDKIWGNSSCPSASQTHMQALHQIQRGDSHGPRSFNRLHKCWGGKGNSPQTVQTPNPLVCNKERGKTEVNYRLQGNQPVLGTQALQIGKLAGNFSLPQKRNVGCKNRFETCIFPSWNSRHSEKVHLHSSGRKSFPVSRGLFWNEHPPTTVAKCNESVPEKVEKPRFPVLDLSRRHFIGGKLTPGSKHTAGEDGRRLENLWHGHKREKITADPHSGGKPFGFYSGFQTRQFASSSRETQSSQKRVRQTFDSFRDVMQKNVSNSWSHKIFSHGNAFSEGFHRSAGAICKTAGNFGVGSQGVHPPHFKAASERNELFNGAMERQKISGESTSKVSAFRFLPKGLGWGGCYNRGVSSRVLEREANFAHKCQGIGGGNKYRQVTGKTQGTCLFKSGQFSHILLPEKAGRKNPKSESNGQAFFAMVHGKSDHIRRPIGKEFRGFGRCTQQVGTGQGGLHLKQKLVSVSQEQTGPLCYTNSRHVCLPWQSSAPKFCLKAPPLAGTGGRCPEVPLAKRSGLLCKSALENNWSLASQAKRKQTSEMHAHSPLLGFKCMVAPNSETARQGNPKFSDKTLSGDVQKLLGRVHALSTLAPSLSGCIRSGLQAKQVSLEAQDTYLRGLKSIQRYNASFKLFCGFCICKNFKFMEASLQAVAGMLLEFQNILPTHARFVYSSLLLIPGLDQLTFSPLLKQLKKQWNAPSVRYASFYDASEPLQKLIRHSFNWHSISEVRMQLLLACRFLMLCRNVDLERMFRTISMVGSKPFVLIQRKGWLKPQWEAMVQVPEIPQICPWTLLKKYVALTTSSVVKEGDPVFVSLTPPFLPLKANSIGSITRSGLSTLGVDTSIWKPHSTRGAGVTMMKKLGMSSEEVCEIGKWKNVNAFTGHYLRLNATETLGTRISTLVHKVSPLRSAEADLTWTTRKYDLGGNVREAEAQSNGEPTLPPMDVSNVEDIMIEGEKMDYSHLEELSPNLSMGPEIAVASVGSSDMASSSNACMGPDPYFPVPSSPALPEQHPHDGVAVLDNVPERAPRNKRKASPRGSPPRKFEFSAQRARDVHP